MREEQYVFMALRPGCDIDLSKAWPGCTSMMWDVEHGEADHNYLRRRQIELAADLNREVALYVYNGFTWRWEYLGRALPNGDRYGGLGDGPYVLRPDGKGYNRKKEGGAR